jgi:hypothetical protein
MDEYDVFMDAVNRRIATQTLLEFALEENNLQFVLLTPQVGLLESKMRCAAVHCSVYHPQPGLPCVYCLAAYVHSRTQEAGCVTVVHEHHQAGMQELACAVALSIVSRQQLPGRSIQASMTLWLLVCQVDEAHAACARCPCTIWVCPTTISC